MLTEMSMDERSTAAVFVTKLEAARRQIDAAIRMTLRNEDQLAIHTVASAAYNILRDVKSKRGQSELADAVKTGLFVSAKDFLRARDAGKSVELILLEGAEDTIRMIADGIEAGRIESPSDISISVGNERQHWANFVKNANFLKHADRDTDAFLPEGEIDNDLLILTASRSYGDLLGQLTPEMLVFGRSYFTLHPDGGDHGFTGQLQNRYRRLSPSARRKWCLRIIFSAKRR